MSRKAHHTPNGASRLLNVVPGGETASIGLTQALTQDTPPGPDRAGRPGTVCSQEWRPQPSQDLSRAAGAGPGPRSGGVTDGPWGHGPRASRRPIV